MNTSWERWVREVTGGASSRAVGEKIGKSHTTALVWLQRPTAESAIMLAIAYRANPIEALTVAGFLTNGELTATDPDAELKDIPSVRLTAELYRRAREADRARQVPERDAFEGLRPEPK